MGLIYYIMYDDFYILFFLFHARRTTPTNPKWWRELQFVVQNLLKWVPLDLQVSYD